jgi:hypothetical protein
MCEWMVTADELYEFNSYTLCHEMGLCDLIRVSTIDVMKYILSNSRGYDIHHFLVWLSLHRHVFFRQFMFFLSDISSELVNTIFMLYSTQEKQTVCDYGFWI